MIQRIRRLSLSQKLTLLTYVVLLASSILFPRCAQAQSTVLGRNIFSVVDVTWERLQARNPWMYQLDNRPWKTWLIHGALTVTGGQVIAAATPLTARQGRIIVAAFYVVREAYNIGVEKNRRYGDALGDVALPILVARWRF